MELGIFLEKYLLEAEFMVVERRFPDRTRYVRAQGIGAAVGRTFSKVGSRVAPLDLQGVDVGVALADEDSSLVTLSVDLSTGRIGHGGGRVAGTGAGRRGHAGGDRAGHHRAAPAGAGGASAWRRPGRWARAAPTGLIVRPDAEQARGLP